MYSVFLPRYTIGIDAFDAFCEIPYHTCALYYGQHAWEASERKVLAALKSAGIRILDQGVYGHEATIENAEMIIASAGAQEADCLIALGGGKCIDTVKYAGCKMNKPVYTCASIASTCAAVTRISIMYHEDHSFREITQLKQPPEHCYIDTEIISEAPVKYLWAGIGDTMAKHVESAFSARGDELDFPSELGIKIGDLCFYGMLEYGAQAYEDATTHEVTPALEKAIQNIVISTGSVSVSVSSKYNSALAHALFYGLTVRPSIERDHLHGEVVSYGTLVQLMMDDQKEMLKQAYTFNKAIQLPVKLSDLDLDVNSDLSDILKTAEENQELEHVPYPVTADRIYKAMKQLEAYRIEEA
ncbi:MAG: iron-containing alcohol dehydrogenase family protein [Erysipelotrichia bacterium]|nr:iron-containing alcohol dehydrogenase family protein [Erysipelotrichia bacterium]